MSYSAVADEADDASDDSGEEEGAEQLAPAVIHGLPAASAGAMNQGSPPATVICSDGGAGGGGGEQAPCAARCCPKGTNPSRPHADDLD